MLVAPTSVLRGDAVEPLDVPCGSTAESVEYWRSVRRAPDGVDGNRHALRLADCLESRDPELRDRIAYEVLTYWLRGDRLDRATTDGLHAKLLAWMHRGEGEAGTDDAIARAFASLVLSELVRHDTGHLQWTKDQLTQTLDATLQMLARERDFRGLDPDVGWIHAIAHGSDVLWRLTLHPSTTAPQLRAILPGVASVVAPEGAHAYVHNEADRLARVVSGAVARDLLASDWVASWVSDVGQPKHLGAWSEAFASVEGMAELHNRKQFLRALRQQLQGADDGQVLRAVDTALADLP